MEDRLVELLVVRIWQEEGQERQEARPAFHDDLRTITDEDGTVGHEFVADGPNQLWLTNITQHKTDQGKVYLCVVKDSFGKKIVGYSISSAMKSSIAVQALEKAVQVRGAVTDCVVHSDRGSQFRSRKFLRALVRHRLLGSMGRVAAAGDNAAMESFFALLQKNVLDRRCWLTREQLPDLAQF